ncbi:hypothetical protein PVAG01_01132 [Phlyctema vagabunda]|uniref:Uncharacterized protein n=1 Tax=Phlyctema vagabunda TaxID=108571 RepID=A0ABR4PWA6_9HELO
MKLIEPIEEHNMTSAFPTPAATAYTSSDADADTDTESTGTVSGGGSNILGQRNAVPCAGATFMIRSLAFADNENSVVVMALEAGELRLHKLTTASRAGGWDWQCIEKDNWLGFRNSVSGTYMGHNGKGRIVARAEWHRDHEYFCVRKHPDRGYILLTKRGGSKLCKLGWSGGGGGGAVGEGPGGDELVEVEGTAEGTLWEFIKV